jgi:hypothetical protein
MCRRSICFISFILVLGLVGNAMAQIDPATVTTGHVYLFDNVTATDLPDDSANSNTGTIVADPQVVDGLKGKALQFDGVDDGIQIPDSDFINVNNGPWPNRTVVAVFKCDDVTKQDKQTIFEEGGRTRGLVIYVFGGQVYVGGWNRAEYNWNPGSWLSAPINSNQWYTVALVIRDGAEAVEDNKFEMWLDGDLIGRAVGGRIHNHGDDNAIGYTIQNTVFHDDDGTGDGWFFEGAIDEIWILNDALTAAELNRMIGNVWPYSSGPDPADGSQVDQKSATLTWVVGDTAASHDVYLGTDAGEVAAGTGDTAKGRQTERFYFAADLVAGATYYWRVDEIEADGTTIYTGDVWSFKVKRPTAGDPSPADGARYVDPDVVLSWDPGLGAIIHHVYFGTDETEVTDGSGDTYKAPTADATYTPGTLEEGTTYYWRIDEFDGPATHKGDTWSFTTIPHIPIRDPNLVGWWRLDDMGSGTVIDFSGYGHHGTIHGDAHFVPGYDGDAMQFDGQGWVNMDGFKGVLRIAADNQHEFTCAAWIRCTADNGTIMGWGHTSGRQRVEFRINGQRLRVEHGAGNKRGDTNVDDDQWHHVVLVVPRGGNIDDSYFYLDGQLEPIRTVSDGDLFNLTANFDVKLGLRYNEDPADPRWYTGQMDDVRLYDKVLTQEEIQSIMARPNPFTAFDPVPADGAMLDIEQVTALAWSAGDDAAEHDVYLGTDANEVTAADTSDTSGVYRGRQTATSYIPPEGFDWDAAYYWRVDEVDADGTTITTGRVWSFTITDYLNVEDFEAYDDYCNRIFYIWPDGWGHSGDADCGVDPYGGNDTGSTVGYLNAPYAEQTIVNTGSQAMRMAYDNAVSPFYSETQREWASPQDWTRQQVKALTLYFRGHGLSVGSYNYDAGTAVHTLRANGEDIWNVSRQSETGVHDEFHGAFKRLSGAGSIQAHVLSVTFTHTWAKAGVMIRESLAANSMHAMMVVTPAQGVSFQRRTTTGDNSASDTQAGITAPQWVKVERSMAGDFTGYYSDDGVTWTPVGSPISIPMQGDVYIGLVLTSHNTAAVSTAEFSDVTTTGTVTGQWQSQDIGILTNTADPLYVAVEDSTGKTSVVSHEDPNAALATAWQQWNIDTREFTNVDLTRIKKVYLGVGNRENPQVGGTGTAYFDDLRLYRPRCVAELIQPDDDFSDNCVVDYADLQIMTGDWLMTGYEVTAVTASDANLVAYYNMDGNTDDSSGNAYHGVPQGGASYVSGVSGQALHLNGLGQWVAIQDVNYASTGLPEVTVCAWIRTTNPDNQIIGSFDRNEYWRLEINGNGGGPGQVGWDLMTSDGQVDYGSDTRVDDGQWHQVAGVFDNGTLTIYIDGNAEESATGGSTFGSGNTRFGFLGAGSEATAFNGDPGPDDYFQGDLDEVRIYSRALSQAEIANLAGVAEGDVLPQALLPLLATDADTDLYDDETIDLKDFAMLLDSWLDEMLWPQP